MAIPPRPAKALSTLECGALLAESRFGGAEPFDGLPMPLLVGLQGGLRDLHGARGFLGSGTAPCLANGDEMARAEDGCQLLFGVVDGSTEHCGRRLGQEVCQRLSGMRGLGSDQARGDGVGGLKR